MQLKPARILVVDSEEEGLRLQEALLRIERVGEVQTALHPRDALARLSRCEFAIVVASWTLPGQIGADFLQTVAIRHPATRRVVSAPRSRALEEAFGTASLHGLLWRPWRADDVRALVESLLDERP